MTCKRRLLQDISVQFDLLLQIAREILREEGNIMATLDELVAKADEQTELVQRVVDFIEAGGSAADAAKIQTVLDTMEANDQALEDAIAPVPPTP